MQIPGKIIALDGHIATVDFEDVTQNTDVSLLSNVELGHFVTVQAGFAVEILPEEKKRGMYQSSVCNLINGI